ncbi:uncharacterized protein LOC6531752 isoform X1 [Drosophila yakuba]|uniref:Uncharacterized protein n=1 Tax=Drosophila yakuba TaxID=7245 RepID=B4P914_DROYA|nr:uncharacterized protein LOC6531752 isoform X1 [Drosophila yakuba]XP_039228202.1 uncharacterized protein LOC6531752 isoform X1 [Drosophila yakuba]EDW92254.1 uncharacterized protein Dyak_GE11616 [Drosophila yakuba]
MHPMWNRNWSWTLLIFSALLLLLSADVANSEECGQEELTKCSQPLDMLQLTDFSIGPAKKEELEKLCHELRKGVRCIQSYTRRCMDLQQRNQFNKLYHGTIQFIRDLCNKGTFQDEYLKHIPCSKMAKKEFEVCSNRYRETLVFLKPNKNPQNSENGTLNENIKTICCSINEYVDCSEDAARKICSAEAAKFTRQLVEKAVGSLTTTYCEDFTRNPSMCRDGDGNGSTRSAVSSLGLLLTGTLLTLLVSRGNR